MIEIFYRPLIDPPQSPSTTLDSARSDESAPADARPLDAVFSAAGAALIPLPDRAVLPGISPPSSLAVQQHANLAIPVPYPDLCDFTNAHAQLRPRVPITAISERSSIHPGNPACAPLAYPVALVQVLDHLPALRGR